MSRIWTVVSLAAISATFAGCLGGDDSNKAGGEDEPEALVLTLANHEPVTYDLDEFASELERQSEGSVRIEFENRWREGERNYERATIEDVREGRVDLAKVSARALDLVGVNSFQPLVAPFVVDSYALEREVLASPLAERMLASVDQLDLVGVALLPGELRKPLGISRPLIAAAHYRDATIGTRPSELGARAIRTLDARPAYHEPGGEISGFDGTEEGIFGIETNRYDGPARTLAANVSLWPRAVVIVMNRNAYESLSEDQRDALLAAGPAALDPAIDDIRFREEEALGILCSRGEVSVRSASDTQLTSLRAATRSVSRALAHDPSTRYITKEIAAMRNKIDAEAPPTCGTDDRGQVTGGATPVDGLWLMETTADELAAIAPPGDVVPENWGEVLFAFQDGRFAYTQENREACTFGYGAYAVEGDVVEWTLEGGGGEGPTGAVNRPDEFFRFAFSLYRDQLTLEPVEGAISPEPYRVEPWRRLDGEPTLEALSDRCPPPDDALKP